MHIPMNNNNNNIIQGFDPLLSINRQQCQESKQFASTDKI